MKLVRYGQPGKEKPGLIDADGKIRDLSAIIPDFAGEYLNRKSLDKLARVRLSRLPLVRGRPRLAAPIAKPGNFIGLCLNYIAHSKEAGPPCPSRGRAGGLPVRLGGRLWLRRSREPAFLRQPHGRAHAERAP